MNDYTTTEEYSNFIIFNLTIFFGIHLVNHVLHLIRKETARQQKII